MFLDRMHKTVGEDQEFLQGPTQTEKSLFVDLWQLIDFQWG